MAEFQPLPKGVASFGATELGKWLYVYSGIQEERISIPRSTCCMASIGFRSRKGSLGVARNGLFCSRRGADLRSSVRLSDRWHAGAERAWCFRRSLLVARSAVFDPATKRWRPLPSLPQPRSSHRAAILDKKLYVLEDGAFREEKMEIGSRMVWSWTLRMNRMVEGARAASDRQSPRCCRT